MSDDAPTGGRPAGRGRGPGPAELDGGSPRRRTGATPAGRFLSYFARAASVGAMMAPDPVLDDDETIRRRTEEGLRESGSGRPGGAARPGRRGSPGLAAPGLSRPPRRPRRAAGGVGGVASRGSTWKAPRNAGRPRRTRPAPQFVKRLFRVDPADPGCTTSCSTRPCSASTPPFAAAVDRGPRRSSTPTRRPSAEPQSRARRGSTRAARRAVLRPAGALAVLRRPPARSGCTGDRSAGGHRRRRRTLGRPALGGRPDPNAGPAAVRLPGVPGGVLPPAAHGNPTGALLARLARLDVEGGPRPGYERDDHRTGAVHLPRPGHRSFRPSGSGPTCRSIRA